MLLDWATRVYELTTIYFFTTEIHHFFLIILLDTQLLLFLKTFIIFLCNSSTELHVSQIKNSRLSMLWIFFDRSVLRGWI